MSIFSRRKKYVVVTADVVAEMSAINQRLEALEKNVGRRRYAPGYAHLVLDMDGNRIKPPSITDELEAIKRHLDVDIKMNPEAEHQFIAKRATKEGKK